MVVHWQARRVAKHGSLPNAIEFMELLLHSHDDIGLLELLQGVSLRPVTGTEKDPFKAVLVLQKIPHPFTKWLEHQLGDLRVKGVFLDLTIVMFADAYPTSWLNVMKFWSHSLTDMRNLRPFRTPNTYFEPPMITIFTAGLGPMRGLKKPSPSTSRPAMPHWKWIPLLRSWKHTGRARPSRIGNPA
jgi:hypothetical protein